MTPDPLHALALTALALAIGAVLAYRLAVGWGWF